MSTNNPKEGAEMVDESSNDTSTDADTDQAAGVNEQPVVIEELLVEEVSIDGMCGVY
jgi:mycofactocin precursor